MSGRSPSWIAAVSAAILHAETSNPVWRGDLLDAILATPDPRITQLEADRAELVAALKRIERRLSAHPDDTLQDDRRDKHIAHGIARATLSKIEGDGK